MVDRYLFRGKRLDNGEWVQGCVALGKPFGSEISIATIIELDTLSFGVEIDPTSIGQYTGVKDKRGVLIFEGDVLRVMFDDCKFVGAVRYGETCVSSCTFYVDTGNGVKLLHQHNKNHIEIIGNIHDNPELLEG